MGKELHVNDTGSNKTEGTGTGKTTGSSTGSSGSGGRGTGRGTSQKTVSPKVVLVEVPGQEKTEEEKLEEKRAKDRERKAKSRANSRSNGTTKKAGTTRKKTASVSDAQQLKILVLTTSQIMASRPGMEMWALSEYEVDQLITPLHSIMSKNEGVGNMMSEYGDHIALIIASFTIFVPKFIMWRNAKPKKEDKQHVRQIGQHPNTGSSGGNKGGTIATNSGTSNAKTTATPQNFNGEYASLIPPSVGI
ncbi:hypothetical protein [Bacillus wiedmannii]|uniref:hypothetical protein n=1 Tax=Bacillus wiedmannii TaxID=1890302 RepID=UPI0026D55241